MIVLCESVRKRERQWADEDGVTALTYRPGQEEHGGDQQATLHVAVTFAR